MNFNVRDKDNQLWNGMITALGANFALVNAAQTESWRKLKYETQLKIYKGMFKTKRHKVMPTMQQTRRNRQKYGVACSKVMNANKLSKEHN